jgi:tuberous sclerosis protein 2
MSPPGQEVEPAFRSRGRSNTNTTFSNFPWRRRNDTQSTPVAPDPALSVHDLIAALTPPAVPSLSTARALSAALANASTVQLYSLTPVLAALCAADAPTSLRAAGFDILASFLERTPALKASDRIALFSLFPARGLNAWHADVWEARFRAFTAFTRGGAEIAGIEIQLLEMLQTWIEATFTGLLVRDSVSSTERAERERSLDALGAFLTTTTSRLETLARLSEPTIGNVLAFLGGLVERALALPSDPTPPSAHASQEFTPGQHPPTPTRTTHRRHHSSASLPLASPIVPSPLGPTPRKPADMAVALYLDHLDAQARYLSPVHLKAIIPVLFRCLAFYASHLPRLSLSSSDQFETQFPLERHIVEVLDPILNGPYTASCFIILRHHLLPRTGAGVTAWRGSVQTATGACRTLRLYVRRALCTRLARSYIARMSADAYTPSGVPGSLTLEHGLMERAWAKDEFTRGDLGKVGRMLRKAAEAWVSVQLEDGGTDSEREEVLLEIAGALRDIFQEYDERADSYDVDVAEDETNVVGDTLLVLARYVRPLKYVTSSRATSLELTYCRNIDGSAFIVPLARPSDAPTSFLRTLSALLSRDHPSTPCNPYLSTILLSIAEHLVDSDTANIINVMFERGDLSPIAHDWLTSWTSILSLPEISSVARPLTRAALLDALQAVSATVRDVPMHRHPLVDLVMDFCVRQDYRKGERDGYEVVWNILADELVLRTIEAQEKEKDANAEDADRVLEETLTTPMLDLLRTTAADGEDGDGDTAASVATSTAPTPTGLMSSNVSPVSARGHFDYLGSQRDRESSAMPAVMSLISSFATGGSAAAARSQPHAPPRPDDTSSMNVPLSAPEPPGMPAALGAVVALVHIFAQLAFTPYSLSDRNRTLAVRVFRILVELVTTAKSARARLAILQFFFRLRVDRDHRLYSVYNRYDRLGSIAVLAGLVGRVDVPSTGEPAHEEPDPQEILKARARAPERNGRHSSRGRDARPSRSTSSRSRSRVPNRQLSSVPASADTKPRKPLWTIPESLPFTIPESDTPSDGPISYDPAGPGDRIVLPVSSLLLAFIELISEEKDWEILSYVLCHLPTLLANKHFFCGPKSRAAIAKLLATLCGKISQGELASGILNWSPGLRPRDAQGLAYFALSVLISYRKCFEPPRQHVLVEVLIAGLSGQPSTIKACLQALSLSAFELPNSMKRFLPNILTKLSQIMTNASMAVHIIDFLAIVGSLPHLYANLTDADFKLVFGVALQYLRLHNRPEQSPDTSWALSQHLRVMSYYIVYLWFLAVKLPDRPKHVKYIARQLLLANGGQDEIDEPAEVCFDWLARYTYASADPRPANSMLSDVLMNAGAHHESVAEKTWVVGNALVTIRALTRIGWVEVVARRASGLTRILARIENVPMVGPGEVDPDMLSVPAVLSMNHEPLSEEDELYQVRLSVACFL